MTDDNKETNKINALYEYLGNHSLDIYADDDEQTFHCGREEYLVLTDDEAQERAAQYIRESLWAFNPEFLASHINGGKQSRFTTPMLIALQSQGAESINDTVAGLVGDEIDDLIDEAISSDGRGHFIGFYDGHEYEQGEFFIYRLN